MTNIDFNERSDWVLETGKSLAPLMNQVHSANLSETFWVRLLTPYIWTVYNQKKYFQSENFDWPIAFQPLNGWTPPDKKKIRNDIVLTAGKSFKAVKPLGMLPWIVQENKSLALGVRAERIAREFDAQTLAFNWIPSIGKARKPARSILFEAVVDESCVIKRNMIRNVPRVYVEYFSNLLRSISSVADKHIENVYFEHFGSFIERLIALYMGENGAALNQLQLGAFIGEVKKSTLPVTRYQYDFHLTYGWKQSDKDIPFFAVRLEEFSENFKIHARMRRDIDILVVYNQVNAKETRDHYEMCTRVLSKHLERRKFPTVTLRPRGYSRWFSGRKDLKFLEKYFPSIDSGKGDIASICARSSLVIHWNYPATNFLECIFVNHPVVCLLTERKELTPLLLEFIPHLIRLRLLHESALQLVHHVNSVDLDTWWAAVKVDPWYCKLQETFARSKKAYLERRVQSFI